VSTGDGRRPELAMGQMVTVFRSRHRAGIEEPYDELAASMLAAAQEAPGFVDFKTFTAEDGERVSVVTFASVEDHEAWRDDVRHRAAQNRGRAEFFAEYSIQAGPCTQLRVWRHEPD
jgi:heme-degrading monooxygenase HmoA